MPKNRVFGRSGGGVTYSIEVLHEYKYVQESAEFIEKAKG